MGILAAAAAMPDWADCMDYVFGRQAVSASDLGIARLAAAERAAFIYQFGPSRAVDSAVDATTTQQ